MKTLIELCMAVDIIIVLLPKIQINPSQVWIYRGFKNKGLKEDDFDGRFTRRIV